MAIQRRHAAASACAGIRAQPSNVRVIGTPERFPFVQLELAGTIGLDPGRYLAREPDRVLVVGIDDAPEPARRRLRRRRPSGVEPDAAPPPLPLTTLTVVRAKPLGSLEDAEAWLAGLRESEEALDAEVDAALVLANAAVHAHRGAALDPNVADVSREHALAVYVGYGIGDELVEGRWKQALAAPRSAERQRRAQALRPQERVAAVLAGRESVAACEALLLRARADLDAGRDREAALQLRVGLEALLAEVEAGGDGAQAEHLAELEGRKRITGEAANEALGGQLSGERTAEVAETLLFCERVLRRRRA